MKTHIYMVKSFFFATLRPICNMYIARKLLRNTFTNNILFITLLFGERTKNSAYFIVQ